MSAVADISSLIKSKVAIDFYILTTIKLKCVLELMALCNYKWQCFFFFGVVTSDVLDSEFSMRPPPIQDAETSE